MGRKGEINRNEMESIVTFGKRRESSFSACRNAITEQCGALGKDEGEQEPLGEASGPAEPQPNINKKSKRQLIGTGDSHL